jgi:apolipoprotein N-acyltransferase
MPGIAKLQRFFKALNTIIREHVKVWWMINIFGLLISWYYTDLVSDSTFQSTICPILVGLFLIGFLIKIVLALGPESRDGGGFFDGFGSGDGGCGGDGSGC